MKPMAAMLSPVFLYGILWACHGGSHGRGHHSRLSTFQDSSLYESDPGRYPGLIYLRCVLRRVVRICALRCARLFGRLSSLLTGVFCPF